MSGGISDIDVRIITLAYWLADGRKIPIGHIQRCKHGMYNKLMHRSLYVYFVLWANNNRRQGPGRLTGGTQVWVLYVEP